MNYKGAIIIVDDDEDDQVIFKDTFDSFDYPNEVIFFPDAETAFEYLKSGIESPFLIISEVKLPKMSGFEFKKKLLDDSTLQGVSIPFIFFTTAANKEIVKDAFKVAVQGFFLKESSMTAFADTVKSIMEYWNKSVTPDTA